MAKNKWIDFLEDTPLSYLNNTQLRQAMKSLSKVTNQRLVRLERADVTQSTVVDTLKARLENIDTKGGMLTRTGRVANRDVSREATIATINAMRDFLGKQTSTIAGIKSYKKEAAAQFAANFDTADAQELTNIADAFKFAREERNKNYHVDSGTVAIAKATEGKSKRAYFAELRKYGYEIKDQRARNFYADFRARL